jgi:hypothetical protein
MGLKQQLRLCTQVLCHDIHELEGLNKRLDFSFSLGVFDDR